MQGVYLLPSFFQQLHCTPAPSLVQKKVLLLCSHISAVHWPHPYLNVLWRQAWHLCREYVWLLFFLHAHGKGAADDLQLAWSIRLAGTFIPLIKHTYLTRGQCRQDKSTLIARHVFILYHSKWRRQLCTNWFPALIAQVGSNTLHAYEQLHLPRNPN